MAGKAGLSGRKANEGETIRLNIQLNPNTMSLAAIEFLKKLEGLDTPAERGAELGKALQVGLATQGQATQGNDIKKKKLLGLARK